MATDVFGDIYNAANEEKRKFIKWGKVGDNVAGTVVDQVIKKCGLPNKEDHSQWEYHIMVEKGFFHEIDPKTKVGIDPVINLKKGETIIVSGKPFLEQKDLSIFDQNMKGLRLGQIIGLNYVEERKAKAKGYSDTKIIKVFKPKSANGEVIMNEDYLNGAPSIAEQQI